MITGKLYDWLKWIALLVLPALATLVLGVSLTYEWENGSKVATVITLVSAFLGTILQVSSAKFKSYLETDEAFDGYVTPEGHNPDTGIPNMAFTISRHPEEFLDQGVVRLKVGSPPANPVYRKPLPDAEVDVQKNRPSE